MTRTSTRSSGISSPRPRSASHGRRTPLTSTARSGPGSRQHALADPEPDFDPIPILEALRRNDVRFVLIGAAAAVAQGSPIPTEDVDITPARDRENLERLAAALRELGAKLRTPKYAAEFPVDGPF